MLKPLAQSSLIGIPTALEQLANKKVVMKTAMMKAWLERSKTELTDLNLAPAPEPAYLELLSDLLNQLLHDLWPLGSAAFVPNKRESENRSFCLAAHSLEYLVGGYQLLGEVLVLRLEKDQSLTGQNYSVISKTIRMIIAQVIGDHRAWEMKQRALNLVQTEIHSDQHEKNDIALRISEEECRLLVQAVPSILWISSPEGDLEFCNRYYSEYVGHDGLIENLWIYWLNAIHSDDLERVLATRKVSIEKGTPYKFEYRLRRKSDGSYRWHLGNGIPIRDDTGTIVKWCGITLDIHEQKEVQQSLEIEQTLREEFINTLSHDLRNPLTVAKTCSQLIALKPDQIENVQNLVVRVVTGINRADKMIQDLLDVNWIKTGRTLALQFGPCDLSALIRVTCEEFTAIQGNRFITEAPTEFQGFWSSKDVQRVLENLLSNAVKYSYSNTPITIRLEPGASDFKLSVHNEGVPIPKEDQGNLFNAFLRSQAAVAGGQKGWGLGLTLVRGVVEAHGGLVGLTSVEGLGTTFTVTLPIDARKKFI